MQLSQKQGIDEFVDKCTARWLFEKTGVQLYTQAMKKCPQDLKPQFQKFLDQEKEHEEMLEDIIRQCGADPHSITPSARITQIESQGIVEVIEKENFKGAIDALLAAELVDNANWELLIILCDKLGDQDTKKKFQKALMEEKDHLRTIRDQILNDSLMLLEKRAA